MSCVPLSTVPVVPITVNRSYRTRSTHCIMAFVFRVGSSGLKFLYSSTSFSIDRSCDWSLLRRPGRVSLMWLVSCSLRTRCKYGVPIRSAMCLWALKNINNVRTQTQHSSVGEQIKVKDLRYKYSWGRKVAMKGNLGIGKSSHWQRRVLISNLKAKY